jgi:hypothetical protein
VPALRSYRYRDDKQVSEYLEQIHDGAVAETTVTQEGGSSRGARVGIAGVGADVGSSRTSSESFTIASTPTSRAAQLEAWLGDQVAVLGPMDTDAFAQVERGEFVRFEGTLEVPEVVRMAFIAASLGQLAELVRSLGQELEDADTVLSQAEALTRLIEIDGFPIVAQERYGGPGIMFLARADLIVGEPAALHGEELTVFGRVKRTTPAGASLTQSELLPSLSQHLPQQNRQQRRASGASGAVRPVSLSGPAALVEPITIYA